MKTILIYLIQMYQKYISPLKKKPACRFYPSCSAYSIEALKKYGALKGSAIALWRILRCNPFSKGGNDPLK